MIVVHSADWGIREFEKETMSAHVYGVTEIVGTSPDGVDAAIEAGIARASTTLRGLHWFEVGEIRGHITESRVGRYQVRLQVGSG